MVAALEQVELVSTSRGIPMRRVWAMPSKNTFDILPIRALVRKYLYQSAVSIDPFARNSKLATFTNDLNPDTAAEYHLLADQFLQVLLDKNVTADLVLFDPPYSPRQIKECYESVGLKMGRLDAMKTNWHPERNLLNRLLVSKGVVISFGWNSMGMGINRGYELIELLLVCHGVGHNDTICTVERKVESAQVDLFNQSHSELSGL